MIVTTVPIIMIYGGPTGPLRRAVGDRSHLASRNAWLPVAIPRPSLQGLLHLTGLLPPSRPWLPACSAPLYSPLAACLVCSSLLLSTALYSSLRLCLALLLSLAGLPVCVMPGPRLSLSVCLCLRLFLSLAVSVFLLVPVAVCFQLLMSKRVGPK